LLITPLPIFFTTGIAVRFALVCNLSFVLCKGHICYKFHGNFIDIHNFLCYRVTPGLSRPTSVTRPSDTGVLTPMPGAEPLRGAPLGLHRTNREGT